MIDLASIRRETGLTQTELAASLGVGQAQVSKIERQGDMLLSTLASYLTALGVAAQLVVEVGEADSGVRPHRREGGSDDDPDRDHPEESPPCCPVLLGLACRRDHGQPASATLPTPSCRTSRASSSRSVPPLCLPSLCSPPCTASRSRSVRGRPGRVYFWAVGTVALIGVGAFAVSFLALRDLMQAIGYSYTTAWIFPAIIDTAVAVSTLMLVALGDKPARRTRPMTASADTELSTCATVGAACEAGCKSRGHTIFTA